MTAFTNDHFDRYRPGSAELLYLHSVDCEEYTAQFEHQNHAPTPECTPVAIASLPHQHDNWSVGTIEDIQALIGDLHGIMRRMMTEGA